VVRVGSAPRPTAVRPDSSATPTAPCSTSRTARFRPSINTGGEKVFPEEVEGVLKGHPAVYDALVVGIPDERFGQRVSAVVAVRPEVVPPAPEELVAHAREHLAGFKVPHRWVLTDHVVRSASGKPDYRWARDAVQATIDIVETADTVDQRS
jgi:acyl-CoA synthetase (AMP-forming)/AMP-acid ligase II